MSIKIGNTITNPNNFTNKERVSLSSVTESNLIIMQSQFSDVNISLYSGQDTNYFTIGKSSNVFKITQNNLPITSFSLTCNIFYSPTYLNNSLIVSQSINIGSTITANEVNTKLIKITPSTILSSNYFIASNTNGLLMSANNNGFVNIIGNVNIGNIQYNPQYSLMVDSNVIIGTTLTVPTLISTNITGNRISGKSVPSSYIDFGVGNRQSLQFNTINNGILCAKLDGNFAVSGTIFADRVTLTNPATSIDNLLVTSNILAASGILTNNSNVKQTTFEINHTNYNSNYDIFDINLFTSRSNIATGTTIQEKVDALTIDSVGRVQIGGVQYTNSLFSVQTTVNNALNTSNLFTLIGNDSNNSIVYINNTGNIGIGTTNPTSRLHITQCYGDSSSNTPLIVLYSQLFNTSNYETGTYTSNISDLIAGYSNNKSVFYINSTGDISANSFNTSNLITSYQLNTSVISANNANNTIDYNNCTISNINIVSTKLITTNNINTSNTISTSNLIARSINTTNLFIPNLEIFNDKGYYAVYTQQLWFTGSNIVMSSLNTDRIADASQGKLVVRTDDQIIVGTGNAIGLNAIGTQQSSIRVTSQQQPNYELFGPNTTTYIGATKTSSGYGANMFYISHLINQNNGVGINVIDNPNLSQLRIYATNNNGISGGTVLENLVYINYNNSGNIGIGILNPLYTLHTKGSFLTQRSDNGLPILYANNVNGGQIQVGVGTTNVFTQLDVMGTIYARTTVGGTVGNIYTDGSIGIGLTYNNSLSANLHVVGTSYFTSNIGIGITPSSSFTLNVNGNTNITSNLYASNIGIGITSPSMFNFDVNGTANFRSNVIINNLKINNPLEGNISGSASTVTNPVQTAITTLNSVTIALLTVTNPITGSISGSANTVRDPVQTAITSVGTLTELNVSSSITASNVIIYNSLFSSNISSSNVTANNFYGALIGTASNATLANTVTNSVQTAITSVGTLSSLNVSSSITASNATIYNSLITSNINPINTSITIGNKNTNIFISGNAIIGQNTTLNTSNAVLYVNGIGTFNSNVNIQGRLITFGNIGSISDKTIKTDLIQINSPLDKIDKLTGYTYIRTDTNTSERETGLIAQDVNEVLPEAVYKNVSYDNLLTISYGNMAGLWVEAFKEMRTEINALKQRISMLELR